MEAKLPPIPEPISLQPKFIEASLPPLTK